MVPTYEGKYDAYHFIYFSIYKEHTTVLLLQQEYCDKPLLTSLHETCGMNPYIYRVIG